MSIGKCFLDLVFFTSFSTSSGKFSKFNVGKSILFQTAQASYFINLIARPRFTRLRINRRINRENCYKDSVASTFNLNLFDRTYYWYHVLYQNQITFPKYPATGVNQLGLLIQAICHYMR